MAESNTTPAAPKLGRRQKAEAAQNAAPENAREEAPSVFRLPKFFTQGAELTAENPPQPASDNGAVAANATPNAPASSVAPAAQFAPTGGAAVAPAGNGVVAGELSELRDEIERLTEQITQVNERESSLERVFDTLHAELSDYKNDFLYEHLKPVVRPLLFLFDSIEQFDTEVALMQNATPNATAPAGTLAASAVRENVEFFRDQLVEALQVCEVTIMEMPSGAFNAKLHKAVDVMPVPQEQDGTIVRVVRMGWFLNGQLLRPAEVVVGKFRAPDKA